MIRIVYFGTPDFACPTLKRLLQDKSDFKIVGVVTQPDKPAGRGRRMQSPPVKLLAQTADLPILQPTSLKGPEVEQSLKDFAADFFVVAAYGKILPQAVLDIPQYECINIHASILPAYRGASPIAHALLAGDDKTGVAIMKMEAGLDTGPVFKISEEEIAPDETTGSLTEKLAMLGAEVLPSVLMSIVHAGLEPKAQDDALASYAPRIAKKDGWLDFSQNAEELARKIRAYAPWPGTFVGKGGQRVKVLKAQFFAGDDGQPGQVLHADAKGIVVACGVGALCLEDIQPAGKKPMSAAAWIAGRGVNSGESFDLEPPNH
ncbi:MAG: methionyl-tRNA formyltransferase [Myxococcota bacterium]|nr:methionyl-tRNA formyltransferase [Myxococcota bacterium]